MATIEVSPRAITTFAAATGLAAEVVAPIIKLDRALALKLREMKWDRQRRLKTRKVSSYRHLILSGQWTGITSMKIGVLPDGTPCKYDGQHRIEAVLAATDPAIADSDPDAYIPMTFIVHDVGSDRIISDEHFAACDSPTAVRSKLDLDEAAGLPEHFEHKSAVLTSLYRGILTVERGLVAPTADDPANMDMSRKRESLEAAREFMEFYYPICERVKEDGTKAKAFSRLTRNAAVLSIMYFLWTYCEDREVFKAFVTRLCTDSAPDAETYPHGDPINRLISLLTNEDMVLPYGTNVPKWTFPFTEAWNAFSKGRSLRSQLRLTEKKRTEGYEHRKFVNTVAKRGIADWRARRSIGA